MTPEVEQALEHLFHHGEGYHCDDCILAAAAIARRIEELANMKVVGVN